MDHNNDQVMQQWKQEMKQITLSDKAMVNIERAVEKAPKKLWSPALILMPFAVTIVLLLVLAGMPAPAGTTTSTDSASTILQPLNGLKIGWAVTANLMAVINYVLMIAVVQKVPRIQHIAMFESFKNHMNKRGIFLLVFVTILFAASGWAMVLLLPFGLMAVQCYIGLLFVPLVVFIQLLMTKNNEWPVCGHCGEVVSKQTMRKRNYGTTPSCEHCGKYLYENGKEKSKAMRINFFVPFIIVVPQLSDSISMYVLIFYVCIYLVIAYVTLKYIAPYTVKFTDDDKIPPLW